MCRLAVTYNLPKVVIKRLAHLQKDGGNSAPVFWSKNNIDLGFNRFAVTTEKNVNQDFPAEGERYVLCYNGEVYGFKNQLFTESQFANDVYFALDKIEKYGLTVFLKDVDWQGAFFVHDKIKNESFIFVDQLNTAGYFYAVYRDSLISASEHAVVFAGLRAAGAPESTPINIVKNGNYLHISNSGKISEKTYRTDYKNVWKGSEFSKSDFKNKSSEIHNAVYEAVNARIPQTGPVAILCSGGVDSSFILSIVVNILRQKREMARLKVFTAGEPNLKKLKPESDLSNVLELLKSLKLNRKKFLKIIDINEIKKMQFQLLAKTVFCKFPRLIPPNPILNTQIRNTVLMSTLLALVIKNDKKIKVVLTGDGADEIFAGYNSMRKGVKNSGGLQKRVVETLRDFPLNDAARVALSAFYGSNFVSKNILKLKEHHPVEVRAPFTSHLVLRALATAHPDYLVSKLGNDIVSKYILRKAALLAKVPYAIAFRKKIPFNEGAVGLSNISPDETEILAAVKASKGIIVNDFLHRERKILTKLKLLDAKQNLKVGKVDAHFIAFIYAYKAGLKQLSMGAVFRNNVEESIYMPRKTDITYLPTKII